MGAAALGSTSCSIEYTSVNSSASASALTAAGAAGAGWGTLGVAGEGTWPPPAAPRRRPPEPIAQHAHAGEGCSKRSRIRWRWTASLRPLISAVWRSSAIRGLGRIAFKRSPHSEQPARWPSSSFHVAEPVQHPDQFVVAQMWEMWTIHLRPPYKSCSSCRSFTTARCMCALTVPISRSRRLPISSRLKSS